MSIQWHGSPPFPWATAPLHHLDADKVAAEECPGLLALKGLPLHHGTPVAGGAPTEAQGGGDSSRHWVGAVQVAQTCPTPSGPLLTHPLFYTENDVFMNFAHERTFGKIKKWIFRFWCAEGTASKRHFQKWKHKFLARPRLWNIRPANNKREYGIWSSRLDEVPKLL